MKQFPRYELRCNKAAVLSLLSFLSIFVTTSALAIDPWDSPEEGGVLIQGSWQLHDVPSLKFPDLNQAGTSVSHPDYALVKWMQATVPGTILACMVANRTLPEPNYRLNMQEVQKHFANLDYVYRTPCDVPPAFAGRRIWLNLEGISRDAVIFVNGQNVGAMNGVWTRGKFDITRVVHPAGANALAVLIRAGTGSSDHAETDKGQGFCGHNIQGNECHPAIPGDGNGIYAEAYLTSTKDVLVRDPYVTTELPRPDNSVADLTVRADLTNVSDRAVSGILQGTIGKLAFERPVTLAAHEHKTVSFEPASFPALHVSSPHLWWPNGYGDPTLQTLHLQFVLPDRSVSDSKGVTFGMRKITYDTTSPQGLRIIVNGVPIFCRGGSWMSPDLFMRYNAVQADIDGRFHRELGFTMVRFWKGQVPFRQAFDACDRYGILVWWEWMGLGEESYTGHNMWGYGGLDNPESTEGVHDMLRRLRSHACVSLYVAQNERGISAEAVQYFRAQQAALDPGTLFIATSCTLPLHRGDGPWSILDPVTYWNKATTFGFYSEIGLPHVLSVESMRTMMPNQVLWPSALPLGWMSALYSSEVWSYHQIDSGNTGGDKYLNKIADSYGVANGIGSFCNKAAALNYDYNRAIMESAGNSMWNGCQGVLLWMSKSAWANLNWSTYDYYNAVDGTYFGSKKACEPVHIQWDVRDGSISVVNATQTAHTGLTATAEVYNLDGTRMGTKTATINAAANQKTAVLTLDKLPGLSEVHFIRLLLKDNQRVVSENFYWDGNSYEKYAALNTLPQIALDLSGSARLDGDETVISAALHNGTHTVAFMPRLGLLRAGSGERVLPTLYSDNYLSMLPGESRIITARCKTADLAGAKPKLNLDGYNVSPVSFEIPSISH